MITIYVHIHNSEPVKMDVEEMPSITAQAIVGKNPRDRADKDVPWVEDGVTTVMIPWWRINYIEVLHDPEHETEIVMPFRD